MHLHYLKLAFRSLLRQKGFTLINLFGLATGMAACLLLLQYISYELSFDTFHSKADRIYRVVNERYQGGDMVQRGTITYPTISANMKKDYPEIRNATRLADFGGTVVRKDDDLQTVAGLYYVDEHFLEIFDFPLLAVATERLLSRDFQVIISKQQADRWFAVKEGTYEDVLGEQVIIDEEDEPYTIVGVLDEVPANSLLLPEMLVSYSSLIQVIGEDVDNSWTWSDFYHYLELEPGVDVAVLEAKFKGFSDRYFRGEEVSGSKELFYLQPLLEAHLQSNDLEYEVGNTTNGKAVWSLLLLAFFILIIAWINYANLSSSRALERAKEVSIRKIAGAKNHQLSGQFFTEALLANFASLMIAIVMFLLVQPYFQRLMEVSWDQLNINRILFQHPALWGTALGLTLLGIMLSAYYPTWMLTSQRMTDVLKGSIRTGKKGQNIRKGLIIFQFTASIALIAGTLMVNRQINFLQEQDLGVNIDQVLTFDPPRLAAWDSTFINRMDAFKQTLIQYPAIQAAASSNRTPGRGTGRLFETRVPSRADDRNYTLSFIQVDHSYAETFGLEAVAGRLFSREDYSPLWEDLNTILINEAAVETFGFAGAEEAIGQVVETYGKPWTIVGVVPDFHQQSLHHPIAPMLLQPAYSTNNPISVKISGEDVSSTLVAIQKTFDDFFPGNAFNYTFLNETFAQQYAADQKFRKLLFFFTLLAILVACLGLSGLAFYAAYLRTKEIGIRKVLGASIQQLSLLLAKDFMGLIIIATLIGLPLAWLGFQSWLTNFAYRIDFPWWAMITAAVGGLLIAFGTISWHAIRAAYTNPIDSLRNE